MRAPVVVVVVVVGCGASAGSRACSGWIGDHRAAGADDGAAVAVATGTRRRCADADGRPERRACLRDECRGLTVLRFGLRERLVGAVHLRFEFVELGVAVDFPPRAAFERIGGLRRRPVLVPAGVFLVLVGHVGTRALVIRTDRTRRQAGRAHHDDAAFYIRILCGHWHAHVAACGAEASGDGWMSSHLRFAQRRKRSRYRYTTGVV